MKTVTPLKNISFPYRELCGALHLHTTFSDGGASYPSLVKAAQDVGLDYIGVTDHMNLKGKEAGFEGFHDSLFVCVGYEHNDKNNLNHYLAFGTQSVMRYLDNPQGYIDRIKNDGGIGFLAHPVEKRHYFKKYPPYPWTDWNVTGFDGIELWNQMSDWLENLKSIRHVLRLFYPRRFLIEIQKELLQKWDTLNRTRFVSGIGGVDAHTMKMNLGFIPLTVFPTKVELKGIRTHLFLDQDLPLNDVDGAKRMLLDALKKGRGFISNFRRHDACGTKIFMEYEDGHIALPGMSELIRMPPAKIKVVLPRSALILCIKNGTCIESKNSDSAEFAVTSTGLYRIEVRLGKYAWIYSNPFCIGGYPLW